MVFDCTKGKEPVYLVMIHYWWGSDKNYFHYYKEAKEFFEKICPENHGGCSVSLYDLRKDIRKAFKKQ